MPDDLLIARLSALNDAERRLGLNLVLHLREFDDRRLYEGLGFSRWDTDVLYRHRAVAAR